MHQNYGKSIYNVEEKVLFCLLSLTVVLNFWNLLPEQKMQTGESGRFAED